MFLGLRKRPAAGNRFLIAGDAAGLIEFFSGNGIPQAYISGEMAALRMAEALEKNDFSAAFLQGYQRSLFSRLKPNPAFGRLVFRQLHRPGFQRRFLSFVDRVASSPGGRNWWIPFCIPEDRDWRSSIPSCGTAFCESLPGPQNPKKRTFRCRKNSCRPDPRNYQKSRPSTRANPCPTPMHMVTRA
jgi:hypothetical protein